MSDIIKTSASRAAVFAAASLGLLFAATPAASQSHFMQPVREHVVLQFFSSGGDGDCPGGGDDSAHLYMYRVFPDGTNARYEVPKDKALVVTEFDSRAYIPSGTANARSVVNTYLRLTPSNIFHGTLVYHSSFHLINDLDAQGFAVNGQMPAGIVVGSGMALCPAMSVDQFSLIVTSGYLRGYLIDDLSSNLRLAGDDPQIKEVR